MRRTILAMAAVALATPALADWKWDESKDKITDVTNVTAMVVTDRAMIDGRYGHNAALSLSCLNNKRSILVLWDFPVSITGQSVLSYRFEGGTGHQLDNAVFPGTNRQAIFDTATVAQFIKEAQTSNSLLIRVSTVGFSPAEATFPTKGADVVKRFAAACPHK